MLCLWGNTQTRANMICFLYFTFFFCLLHVWKRHNKTTNVDQMCHILILLQHVQRAVSLSLLSLFCFGFFVCLFLFFRPSTINPDLTPLHQHTTLLMAYVLFFCCKIILKEKKWRKNCKKKNKQKENSLLQVVQLSVLAVQAAAGGHLSKYITVIWIKTTEHMK